MNDVGSVLLSVRAEARQLVAADYAVMEGMIEHTAGSKAEAVRSVASTVNRLTAELDALGGVPFDQSAQRRPLTWSAHSSSTHEERYHDKETRRVEPTGQVTATVTLRVTVRDLDMLDALSAVLAAHQNLNVHSVTWHVDWDNPVWPQVRAAAIRTAIAKARDYAAALGGTLQQVEHVADAGLLGGDAAGYDSRKAPQTARAMSMNPGTGEPGTPALNPVPLELIATIDARVRSTGVSLPET
jgi:uncharacterized protein YggE